MAGIIFPGPGDDANLANLVNGTEEGDTVLGGNGNDTINGLGGNDLLTGNAQNDSVDGGAGDDRISGGELGDDIVFGDTGNDVIYDSNGRDVLAGGTGNDLIVVRDRSVAYGGTGNDTVHLGASGLINLGLKVGQDGLAGEGGFDLLIFGGGVSFDVASFRALNAGFEQIRADNAIEGSNANNVLDFAGLQAIGTRALHVRGLGGDDRLTGLDSSIGDSLFGGNGNDTLSGNGGGDVLLGGFDADTLFGGAGDDTLFGGENGGDFAHGGAGDDRIATADVGRAFGGSGQDTITLIDALVTDESIDGDDPLDQAATGIDTLVVSGNSLFAVTRFSMSDSSLERLTAESAIIGNQFDNDLDFFGVGVSGARPFFDGQGGNDTIAATPVDDLINGREGDDSLSGGAGEDEIYGEFNSDTIDGGAGRDTLYGGPGSDVIRGGADGDIIEDEGQISIDCGGGDDNVHIVNAALKAFGVLGGAGRDSVKIDGSSTVGGFFGRGQGFEDLGPGNVWFGDAGDNTYDLRGMTGGAIVSGQNGDDRMIGALGACRFLGEGGNDYLEAFGTGSQLFGGDNNDSLKLRFGAFTVDGGTGSDTLLAPDFPVMRLGAPAAAPAGVRIDLSRSAAQATGAGSYTLTNIENVTGSSRGDTLIGGGAANMLAGAGGNDALVGGLGDDVLNGGVGADTASFATSAVAVTVSLQARGARNTGQGLDTLISIESATGSRLGDVLVGSRGNNVLQGLGGADTIAGGLGNDVLAGGAGKDNLSGGGGRDVFRYGALAESTAAAGGRDQIAGFVHLADRIDLSAIDAKGGTPGVNDAFAFVGAAEFSTEGQIRAVQAGRHALVEINTLGAAGAEMHLLLLNVSAAALTQADFLA